MTGNLKKKGKEKKEEKGGKKEKKEKKKRENIFKIETSPLSDPKTKIRLYKK